MESKSESMGTDAEAAVGKQVKPEYARYGKYTKQTEWTLPQWLDITWENFSKDVPAVIPVDCVGGWGEWSECSTSCGDGTQSRTYSIEVEADHGGTQCDNTNEDAETQICNFGECPLCFGEDSAGFSYMPVACYSTSCMEIDGLGSGQFYGTRNEAEQICSQCRCNVLHDWGRDDKNWRACTDANPGSGAIVAFVQSCSPETAVADDSRSYGHQVTHGMASSKVILPNDFQAIERQTNQRLKQANRALRQALEELQSN